MSNVITSRGEVPAPALRRWGALLVAGVLSCLAVALSAGPATAHASLVATDPAEGAQLDRAPRTLTLEFSEAIEPTFVAVNLRLDGGAPERLSSRTEGRRITAQTPAAASSGAASSWQVDYRVVSADGHPITGSVSFTVTAAEDDSAPTDPAESPATREPTSGESVSVEEPDSADGSAGEVTQGETSSDARTGSAWLATLVIGAITALTVAVALMWMSRGRFRRR